MQHAIPDACKPRSYHSDYMAIGKAAEEIVLTWLSKKPYVLGIEDFRSLRQVHDADIDFALHLIDGRVTLAEVKSDYHLGITGNVLFEVLRINHTAPPERAVTLGWSARSPAMWLLCYAPQKQAIYQCKFSDLRCALQTYTQRARQSGKTDGKIAISQVNTDAIKTTINILIPWSYCEQIFTVHVL